MEVKLPAMLEECMFGGDKNALDWRNRFIDAARSAFREGGLDFEAVMGEKFEDMLRKAADVFIGQYRLIQVDDILYDDVRDIEAYREMAELAGEISLWSTGDIPNLHQKTKIINSRVLKVMAEGTSDDFTRRNDIIADDKVPELVRAADAFVEANRPGEVLVVLFDDSEGNFPEAAKALDRWEEARKLAGRGPLKVHRLFVRAKRGKNADKEWKEFQAEEADSLYRLNDLIRGKVREMGHPGRDGVIVFLDFDGSLSDNLELRKRQKQVAWRRLQAFFDGVIEECVRDHLPKLKREEREREFKSRFRLMLKDFAEPLTGGDAWQLAVRNTLRSVSALPADYPVYLAAQILMKIDKWIETGDPGVLSFEKEMFCCREGLLRGYFEDDVKPLIKSLLTIMRRLIRVESGRDELTEYYIYLGLIVKTVEEQGIDQGIFDDPENIRAAGIKNDARLITELVAFDRDGAPVDLRSYPLRAGDEKVSLEDAVAIFRDACVEVQEDYYRYLKGLCPDGAVIETRIKGGESLLLKLLKEHKTRLGQLTDVIGFRVLTDNEAEARGVYEKVRNDMEEGGMKEWITMDNPTRNGYRSMDITGRHKGSGELVQVQVRTKAMEESGFYDCSNVRNYKYESGIKLQDSVVRAFGEYMSLVRRIILDLERAYAETAASEPLGGRKIREIFGMYLKNDS